MGLNSVHPKSGRFCVLRTVSDPEEGDNFFLDDSTPNPLVLLGNAGCHPWKLSSKLHLRFHSCHCWVGVSALQPHPRFLLGVL